MPLSRDTFTRIKGNIYFANDTKDNPGEGERRTKRLWKVQWLLDAFHARCQWFWSTGNVVALDEMMVRVFNTVLVAM